ncbi:MAG: hypothetical protein K6A97_03140 [Lachnospiraceae bacterium]|nr:hypothetical protein [Lachnospiraceae bacterium]
MKRITVLLIVLSMLICMAACGKNSGGDGQSGNDGTNVTKSVSGEKNTSDKEAADESAVNKTSDNAKAEEPPMIPGVLNFYDLDDRDASVLTGLRTVGNRIGNSYNADDYLGINDWPASSDHIRFIFAIDEWVELYPDSNLEYGLRLWVLEHREDQSYYENAKFSDLMPGFKTYIDLRPEPDAPDYPWGSFYLNPDECTPGYYDLVFTYDGKAIATLLTKFYNETDLDGMDDKELTKLMEDEQALAGGGALATPKPAAKKDNSGEESVESIEEDVAESDTSSYVFPGYTTEAPWPEAAVWEAMGLPNLYVDDAGKVSISDKEWIYPLNAKDGVLFEARPESSHFDDLVAALNEAGIEGEDSSDSFDSYYEAYYTYNGVDMAVKISEFDTGKLTILVRFLPED